LYVREAENDFVLFPFSSEGEVYPRGYGWKIRGRRRNSKKKIGFKYEISLKKWDRLKYSSISAIFSVYVLEDI
jgi:hypothetical protein